jgi:hypothetical protein
MATQSQPQPEIFGPGMFEDGAGDSVPFTGSALAAQERGQLEQMIASAERRPRSIEKFRLELEKYACLTPDVALTMFYTLKRAEKPIVGPSVRFAEVLLTCYRNCRAGTRPMGADSTTVSAQGIFYDCEANVGLTVEAQRSIMGNRGRFSNDMITVTGNAAASVAYRNAIFRGVPKALWQDIYEKAKETAVGKAESFAASVVTAMEYFAKSGATEIMVLNTLGVVSVRDIDKDHILVMRVWAKELKDGDKTVEDIFGSPADNEIETIMDSLNWSGAQKTMARTNYKGRRDELLEYLRNQAKAVSEATGNKVGPTVVKGKPVAAKESVAADPTPSSTAEPDSTTISADQTSSPTKPSVSSTTGKATGTTAAASTLQASKPATTEDW